MDRVDCTAAARYSLVAYDFDVVHSFQVDAVPTADTIVRPKTVNRMSKSTIPNMAVPDAQSTCVGIR